MQDVEEKLRQKSNNIVHLLSFLYLWCNKQINLEQFHGESKSILR